MVENSGLSDLNPPSGHRRSRADYRKVTVTLPPDQEQFLSNFAFKLRQRGGRKLATTEIVRAAISALAELDEAGSIDLDNIGDEELLARSIVRAVNGVPKGH